MLVAVLVSVFIWLMQAVGLGEGVGERGVVKGLPYSAWTAWVHLIQVAKDCGTCNTSTMEKRDVIQEKLYEVQVTPTLELSLPDVGIPGQETFFVRSAWVYGITYFVRQVTQGDVSFQFEQDGNEVTIDFGDEGVRARNDDTQGPIVIHFGSSDNDQQSIGDQDFDVKDFHARNARARFHVQDFDRTTWEALLCIPHMGCRRRGIWTLWPWNGLCQGLNVHPFLKQCPCPCWCLLTSSLLL
jgi:hypothetical protein